MDGGRSNTLVKLGNWLGILVFGAVLIFFSQGTLYAGDGAPKRVLILQSYHQGYIWTDDIMAGAGEVFSGLQEPIYLQIEYLDTKRYTETEYVFHFLEEILNYKLKKQSFDVVLAADNDAFNYVLRHRNDIFQNSSIVFCGINNFNPSQITGQHGITGIAEYPSFRETIEVALRLHPGTKEIVFIGSNENITDKINRKLLLALRPEFQDRVSFTFLDKPTIENLTDKLKTLKTGVLVLIYGQVTEGPGEYLPSSEASKRIRQASAVPLYGFWDFYLGKGIVGGKLLSGRRQGQLAAQLVLRILKGEDADSLPVMRTDVNQYMFDYQELKRFDLPEDRLPENSFVINRPHPFYSLKKSHLWAGLGIIASLGTLTVVLLWLFLGRQRLVKTLSRQAQMIDQVHEAVITTDLDCRVQTWNPGAQKLFGFSEEEMMGKAVSLLTPPEKAPLIRQNMVETLKEGRLWKGEVQFVGKNNKIGVCETHITPIMDEKGRPTAGIGVSRDVTEQKELEKQLQLAQKMEIIGTLAGGIAHDFNNILASVLNSAEMALADISEESPLRELLEIIIRAGNRGKNLVKKLSTFSRRGTKEQQFIQMENLLGESLQLLRASLPATIEIRQQITSDLGLVFVDPTQIQQVILNLCTNASHAMGDAGGILEVKLQKTKLDETSAFNLKLTPGNYLMLTVKDTGCGMDPETLEQIFDPFFTTRMEKGGTGLGLTVVQNIVKHCRGAPLPLRAR